MDNQPNQIISPGAFQLCQALCNNNSRCLNYADKDGYCWLHQPKRASQSQHNSRQSKDHEESAS